MNRGERETGAADAFRARARARLSLDLPDGALDPTRPTPRGDHQLDPSMAPADDLPHRPAAVLVPIVTHREPTVLLTLRSSALPDHAGQIAFPGGKIDAEDDTPVAAALREAEEEIGLAAAAVTPLGFLDLYLSRTGYRILPVVAEVAPGAPLRLNAREVDEAFEVPLAFLMDPAHHQRHTRLWKGRERTYYAMPYGERYIWGVTAGILRNLWERIYR